MLYAGKNTPSILQSVQPMWCEPIANKKKTVEVRKTKPKIPTPFKVYIYCTLGSNNKKTNNNLWIVDESGFNWLGNGKVIGEYVCDQITTISSQVVSNSWRYASGYRQEYEKIILTEMALLTEKQVHNYAKGKPLYGWHISDLVIYDKPKELSEFKTFCKDYFDGNHCEDCEYFIDGRGYEYDESDCGCDGLKPLTRPPQSWCYIEEVV